MPAIEIELADAIVSHVAAGSYSQVPAAVTREYLFIVGEAAPATLLVAVVPAEDETERIARSVDKHEIAIDVVIIKQATPTDKAALDALAQFAQDIRDRLRLQPYTVSGRACMPIQAVRNPLFDRTALRERNTFLSVCRMKYMLVRT